MPETGIGLAFVDLSTGEFRATEFAGEKAEARLRDELGILRPREILLPRPATLFPMAASADLNGLGAVETRLDDWVFEGNYAARILKEQFRVAELDGFGLTEHALATAAAGALVHYLRDTSAIGARTPEDTAAVPSMRPAGAGLEHLDRISYYEQQDAMILDQVTVRNLELVEPATVIVRLAAHHEGEEAAVAPLVLAPIGEYVKIGCSLNSGCSLRWSEMFW